MLRIAGFEMDVDLVVSLWNWIHGAFGHFWC